MSDNIGPGALDKPTAGWGMSWPVYWLGIVALILVAVGLPSLLIDAWLYSRWGGATGILDRDGGGAGMVEDDRFFLGLSGELTEVTRRTYRTKAVVELLSLLLLVGILMGAVAEYFRLREKARHAGGPKGPGG